MKDENKDIKEFFEKLRTEDDRSLKVPTFETIAPKKSRPVRFMAMVASIAAVLAVVLFLTKEESNEKVTAQNELVLTIILTTDENEEFLLDDLSSLSEWQASSDILINEFDE